MCGSCHVWSMEIGVEFWHIHWILNLCFHLIFSWKKLWPNFVFWGNLKILKCLNSMLNTSERLALFLDLIFFSWQSKRKQRFKIWQQFQYLTPISTLWMWHDSNISLIFQNFALGKKCCYFTFYFRNLLTLLRKNLVRFLMPW